MIDWTKPQSEEFIEKYAACLNENSWACISIWQKLSEEFIDRHADKLNWFYISCKQRLSEKLIEKHKDKVDWVCISGQQKLSEDFIRRHATDVDWSRICNHQILSEEFIEEFVDRIPNAGVWVLISWGQKLSEAFIERHKDDLDWCSICMYQKLSEDFIRKYSDRIIWQGLFTCQKLSLDFLDKYFSGASWLPFDTICTAEICKYQELSESFIERHADKVNWSVVGEYQKLSPAFREKHNIAMPNDNWLYKSTAFKKKAVQKTGLYECYDDYFIAYKGIRRDRYSLYNFQYKYENGGVYESTADHTRSEGSFGLSAWTEEEAASYTRSVAGYAQGIVVRVKIYYKDVARVVQEGGKIRATKIEVLD